MKIAILSCFYPFRGGLAQFNACLANELGRGHEVRCFNFTTQYPSLLFPGKTQYVTPEDQAYKIESTAILSSVNPFTWGRTAKAIREWGADLLILRYWMSWFAPSLGWVSRRVGPGCKVLAITDNIIPHERHFFDAPLTKWFLKAVDGCVCMSDFVASELEALCPKMPHKVIPHPVYTHFGELLTRDEAQDALGLPHGGTTLLFFGLIRKYKGLDILLRAFDALPQDYHLVIAGEPYGDFAEYQQLIDASPAKDRIFAFTSYIPDEDVRKYFCASDAVVLPYRSATQSGVWALALNFGVPMIVTDTGSLRATVEGTGTGLVVDSPTPECVSEGVLKLFGTPGLVSSCKQHISEQKEILSWSGFCKRLVSFTESL
ncbi:MAG: glycosyltransferase [Bacteroidales bacterium]|nr:glycosyltransferase [Bacteroidales bacterium]